MQGVEHVPGAGEFGKHTQREDPMRFGCEELPATEREQEGRMRTVSWNREAETGCTTSSRPRVVPSARSGSLLELNMRCEPAVSADSAELSLQMVDFKSSGRPIHCPTKNVEDYMQQILRC
ncbi:uncharacterized protein [Physcomitrium patens]|uniref:uncharacterized protein n=1 Tax=Physcomitrium patens TaxID=3218 RepID=UPI000D1578E7|nr:uncharacterized protein LOC112279733 [Physcomitrium patens]|eukprot:XP_024370177.1 uncharacterized protein LOC112279733 [Physcomitrella patens]